MESQKIINLLESSDDDADDKLKFQTRKWYIINDQNNGEYGKGSENESTIKFNTEVIKSNLCNYPDAYILVTGVIATAGGNNITNVCFEHCNIFTRCVTHLNDEHVETAENLNLVMNIYNLIELSDNYSDTSGSLFQFKRNEQPLNAAGNKDHVTVHDSSSFKYKSNSLK